MTEPKTREDEQRINERLLATGVMENPLTLTLESWQIEMLRTGATSTANAAVQTLAQRGDMYGAMSAEAHLNTIINGFMVPFFEVAAPLLEADPETDSFTFEVQTGAALAFTSLNVSTIMINEMPRPTRPIPPADDVTTMVSDQEMLWWALVPLVAQFPQPVQVILTEETGLNFEEIR